MGSSGCLALLLYEDFRAFLVMVHWSDEDLSHSLIVKSIMSDLFRFWPGVDSCVYVNGLSQRQMRDVQQRIEAFTYPQRAAYQLCLAQVFDAAEVQMWLSKI